MLKKSYSATLSYILLNIISQTDYLNLSFFIRLVGNKTFSEQPKAMNVLIFELREEDTVLSRLRKSFPGVGFKKYDLNMELESEGPKLIVIDTVQGIDHVTLLEDLHFISPGRALKGSGSMITLRILKSIGSIDSALVIAVPAEYPTKDAIEEIIPIIRELSGD
jgi:hypothetical protein